MTRKCRCGGTYESLMPTQHYAPVIKAVCNKCKREVQQRHRSAPGTSRIPYCDKCGGSIWSKDPKGHARYCHPRVRATPTNRCPAEVGYDWVAKPRCIWAHHVDGRHMTEDYIHFDDTLLKGVLDMKMMGLIDMAKRKVAEG